MEQISYSTEMILVAVAVVVLIAIVAYRVVTKKMKLSSKVTIIEQADLLMAALPRAMAEKALEDPLLASTSHSEQAHNRLHIAAIYLLTCLTGIHHANGKATYTQSKAFDKLLAKVLPRLKQLYIERGTKPERAIELMKMNLNKIKALINTYCKQSKQANTDATLAIQAWFEELSYINLANKPYLTDTLLTLTKNSKEQEFIKTLCAPKTYSLLLNKVRDNTESFIRLTQAISHQASQTQGNEVINRTYFEHYTMAFLLILGITVIKEAKGDPHYLQTSEYLALKNKAMTVTKSLLLNSRKVGVQSLDTAQINNIMTLLQQQLGALQIACLNYLKTADTQSDEAVNYLFDWYKQSLASNANASTIIKDYIKSELAS